MLFQTTITLEDRVKSVLSDLIGAGEPFTILDVSNAVKKDGNGFVRHRDVRPITVDFIENETIVGVEDYISTQIQVSTPKGLNYANLYHLEDYDADDYINRQQKALSPSEIDTNTTAKNSTCTPVAKCDDSNKGTIFTHSTPVKKSSNMSQNARAFKLPKPRSDGAVEIPMEVLVTANLLNVDVEIINHPNSISIVPATTSSKYVRTSRAGMRLSKSCLKKSNLNSKSSLEAAAFTNKIVFG